MSQFPQALAQAGDKNKDLLATLSRTDYALPSLQQNVSYISDLKAQMSKLEGDLKKLHAVTQDERKDHLKYRDSTMKRFAHRLGGQKGKEKFSEKAEKEEREFLEAWQKEREADEAHEELSKALQRAEKDRQHLEVDKSRHTSAQQELDALYQQIFSGPTPEVPGEDQLEVAVLGCRQNFINCQATVDRATSALDALTSAVKAMVFGQTFISEALSASNWDMWGGGTFADMMERDALSNAQNQVMHAKRYVDDARRTEPAIGLMSSVEIDNGHLLSDVLFDNIFSDMAQHERIERSQFKMQQALQQLRHQADEQKQRLQQARSQLRQATADLRSARHELQDIRAQAIEQFAGSNAAPPPAYSEVWPNA